MYLLTQYCPQSQGKNSSNTLCNKVHFYLAWFLWLNEWKKTDYNLLVGQLQIALRHTAKVLTRRDKESTRFPISNACCIS